MPVHVCCPGSPRSPGWAGLNSRRAHVTAEIVAVLDPQVEVFPFGGGRPHAEVEALRWAGDAARGATLYATLEPCSHHGKTPPCVDAIMAAGIARVVSALEDPNPKIAGEGHARLRAQGVAVDVGLGAEDARRAHAGHIRRVRD